MRQRLKIVRIFDNSVAIIVLLKSKAFYIPLVVNVMS